MATSEGDDLRAALAAAQALDPRDGRGGGQDPGGGPGEAGSRGGKGEGGDDRPEAGHAPDLGVADQGELLQQAGRRHHRGGPGRACKTAGGRAVEGVMTQQDRDAREEADELEADTQ